MVMVMALGTYTRPRYFLCAQLARSEVIRGTS